MRIFQIEGSENSPWVWLDEKSGTLEISGISSFRNPFQFYLCLAKWIHAFNLGEHKTHVVKMRFDFIDEASIRGLEYVIQQLNKLSGDTENLIVNWYYSKENRLIHKVGQQYSCQSRIQFNLVAA